MPPQQQPSASTLTALLAQADPAGQPLPAVAYAAARQAMTLAQAQGQTAEAALAGVYLSAHALSLGFYAEVLAVAGPVLQELAAPPLSQLLTHQRRELLRIHVLAACETGEFDRALDSAQELVRQVAALGEPAAALQAAFSLAVCFERMGDSWQACRVATDALNVHGQASPALSQLKMQNLLCAISIGLFHSSNGALPQAEVRHVLNQALEAGTQALRLLEQPADPMNEVVIYGNLGEVLMYCGDMDQSQRHLKRAMQVARERGFVAYEWRMRCTQAVWLLLQGQAAAALADMRSLMAEMNDQAPRQTMIRAHHAAYRACRELGHLELEQALQHFETVERLERQRAIQQLRAQSQLFVTRTEARQAQWQAEHARQEAMTQRARAAEFAASAECDPLTGLGNRRHFDRRVDELLPALQQADQPTALVLIDVDMFKHVNDTHGHAVGDQVLMTLAALLRENTRARDIVARYGGEEFVMVLPGMGLAQAREVCERLRERVAACTQLSTSVTTVRATISLGLAVSPPYDVDRLLKSADDALYRAKSEGRNCLRMASPVLTADHASVLAVNHHSR